MCLQDIPFEPQHPREDHEATCLQHGTLLVNGPRGVNIQVQPMDDGSLNKQDNNSAMFANPVGPPVEDPQLQESHEPQQPESRATAQLPNHSVQEIPDL